MNTFSTPSIRESFAPARDEAEIQTLLNTDAYKFFMLDFILAHSEYRTMQVRWKMKIRTPDVRIADVIPESSLREQLDATRSIRGISSSERDYLSNLTTTRLSRETLDFLSWFQLPEYELTSDNQGGYDLAFEGTWADSTLWEIYALKIVNALYLYHYTQKAELSETEWTSVTQTMFGRLDGNIRQVRTDPRITFSEFGTRRAASTDIHRRIYDILAGELPGQCVGTSNVMLARERGDTNPRGTNAHELRMIPTAFEDEPENIIEKMYAIDREWFAHFPHSGLLLPDTFGSSFYWKNCPRDIVQHHTGCRIDSKEPRVAIPEYLRFLESWGIDPKSKIALPSDGLTYDVIEDTTNRFHATLGMLTYGWGTELSNNTKGTFPKEKETFGPFGSMSIVIKPDAVWRPDRGEWVSCVKLSDNPTKAIGSPERIDLFRKTFGVAGMEAQKVVV